MAPLNLVPYDKHRVSTYKVEQEFPYENRKITATLVTGMGGGAAGWCAKYLVIHVDKLDPSRLSNISDVAVFRANCSSEILPNWISATHLNVAYTFGKSETVFMRPFTNDGRVSVTFDPSMR